MEGITIHVDEGHESRVIQTYTPHGQIRQMVLAELDTKNKEMRITSIYPQSTSETVVLTEDAMQNLVRFYGTGDVFESAQKQYDDLLIDYQESDKEIARLQAQVEWYKRENEDLKTGRNKAIDECDKATDAYASFCEEHEALRDLRDANELTISNLRGQIEQLQSQESFRTALLESVVSAARVAAEGGYQEWIPLVDALEALDAWQSEAPHAAPAEVAQPQYADIHNQPFIPGPVVG